MTCRCWCRRRSGSRLLTRRGCGSCRKHTTTSMLYSAVSATKHSAICCLISSNSSKSARNLSPGLLRSCPPNFLNRFSSSFFIELFLSVFFACNSSWRCLWSFSFHSTILHFFLNFRFTHVLLVLSVVKSSPNFVDSSHMASRIVKIIIIIIICRFLVHLSDYFTLRCITGSCRCFNASFRQQMCLAVFSK